MTSKAAARCEGEGITGVICRARDLRGHAGLRRERAQSAGSGDESYGARRRWACSPNASSPASTSPAGRVVKGVNFVELRDAGDPVEIARALRRAGRRRTHLPRHHRQQRRARPDPAPSSRRVAAQVFIPLTVGGGVRKVEDVRRLLNAGADKVSINTAAVANPQLVEDASDRFGAQCIVVAIDAKRRGRRGAGRSSPTADARPRGLDAVDGRAKMAAARRGRDPAHQHGPRRHQERLRSGADARRHRCGGCAR